MKRGDNQTIFQSDTSVNVTTTSALAVSENRMRNYLIIQNRGTESVFVKFGEAHSGTEGLEIFSDGNYEPLIAPVTSVYLVAASGAQQVDIVEGLLDPGIPLI